MALLQASDVTIIKIYNVWSRMSLLPRLNSYRLWNSQQKFSSTTVHLHKTRIRILEEDPQLDGS